MIITQPRPARPRVRERSPRRPIRSAHLVGICGSGMKALAELTTDLGWQVSGSDLQPASPALEWMSRRGLRVHQGHDQANLPHTADVLVYSPAVGAENPERRQADALGIPQLSYSRMLGALMKKRTGISVAGTHGKSTTAAMTATILDDAGLRPSAVVGAELVGRGRSGWAGRGDLFVVESCEYQRSFLDLKPQLAVITGIERDHVDCYPTLDETEAAFGAFAAKLPPSGLLLVRADCPASLRAAATCDAVVETFAVDGLGNSVGWHAQTAVLGAVRGPTDHALRSSGRATSRVEHTDWWAADVRPADCGTRFRVFHYGRFFAELTLRVPGEHNVLNALAACALSHAAGASPADIRESLAEFRGVKRRFEIAGSYRGMTLIDDYAHHPTAVAVMLDAARRRFPGRRLWCVFQPHQVSRLRALMDDFARSLRAADQVLVAPVFAARETVGEEAAAARELVERVTAGEGRTGRSARVSRPRLGLDRRSPNGETCGQHGGTVGRPCDNRARHTRCRFAPSLDHILATLDDEARPGDVLLTMGAGDIDRVHHELTGRLCRHHQA